MVSLHGNREITKTKTFRTSRAEAGVISKKVEQGLIEVMMIQLDYFTSSRGSRRGYNLG